MKFTVAWQSSGSDSTALRENVTTSPLWFRSEILANVVGFVSFWRTASLATTQLIPPILTAQIPEILPVSYIASVAGTGLFAAGSVLAAGGSALSRQALGQQTSHHDALIQVCPYLAATLCRFKKRRLERLGASVHRRPPTRVHMQSFTVRQNDRKRLD